MVGFVLVCFSGWLLPFPDSLAKLARAFIASAKPCLHKLLLGPALHVGLHVGLVEFLPAAVIPAVIPLATARTTAHCAALSKA